MARWIPDPRLPVGRSEPIGRRVFNRPDLVGATDQVRPSETLDFRIFEEPRAPGDISLDRLGRTSREPTVIEFLKAKSIAAAARFAKPKQFSGWLVVQAKHLTETSRGPKFPVVASPQHADDPEHELHNPYHAHVSRPAGCETDSYTTALYVKHVYERHAIVLGMTREPRSWLYAIADWVRWIVWRLS